MNLTRVVVESPFAGEVARNIRYVRACLRDCLLRGEAPIASHALYTQEGILDDQKPDERKLGMEAGFTWNKLADKVVVYEDFGHSNGMKAGIEVANTHGIPVEYRTLSKEDLARVLEGV